MISTLKQKVYKLNLAKKINFSRTQKKKKMDADKARSLRVQKRIEEKLGLQGNNQLDCKKIFPFLQEISFLSPSKIILI